MPDLSTLYQAALKFIDQSISSGIVPEDAQNMYVSALTTDKGSIYTALNRTSENGFGGSGCSEHEAADQAAMNNETRITAIVTVSLADRIITMPCEGCCKYLSKLDPQNSYCEVMTSENTSVMLKELMSQNGYVLDPAEIFGDDMFSGFDTPAPPPPPVQTINPEPDMSAAPPQNEPANAQPAYPGADAMTGAQPMYQNGMANGQPMYQNPMMNGQPMYQNGMMNGQPMYQNPMMNGQPMYQNGMMNGQPMYQNPMTNGQPMYQNPMMNGQPVYQNGMMNGQPMYQNPMTNGQPMYQNGMMNAQPVYQNGMVNGQPVYQNGMMNGQNPYQSAAPASGGSMNGYANNANSIYINPTSSTSEDTASAPASSETPDDSPQNNVYQQKLKDFLNISESPLHVPPPAEEPAAPAHDDPASADPSKNPKNMKQMKKELAKAKKAAKKGFFS